MSLRRAFSSRRPGIAALGSEVGRAVVFKQKLYGFADTVNRPDLIESFSLEREPSHIFGDAFRRLNLRPVHGRLLCAFATLGNDSHSPEPYGRFEAFAMVPDGHKYQPKLYFHETQLASARARRQSPSVLERPGKRQNIRLIA